MLRLALPLFLLSAGTSVAAETVCHSGDLVRSVDIVYSDPGQAVPCEVLYNKQSEGVQSVLWRADHQAGYCEEKAQAFIEKLEGMGWQCESDASAAPVVSSDSGVEEAPEVPEAPAAPEAPEPPEALNTDG